MFDRTVISPIRTISLFVHICAFRVGRVIRFFTGLTFLTCAAAAAVTIAIAIATGFSILIFFRILSFIPFSFGIRFFLTIQTFQFRQFLGESNVPCLLGGHFIIFRQNIHGPILFRGDFLQSLYIILTPLHFQIM